MKNKFDLRKELKEYSYLNIKKPVIKAAKRHKDHTWGIKLKIKIYIHHLLLHIFFHMALLFSILISKLKISLDKIKNANIDLKYPVQK